MSIISAQLKAFNMRDFLLGLLATAIVAAALMTC